MITTINTTVTDEMESTFNLEITYEVRGTRVANIEYDMDGCGVFRQVNIWDIIKDKIRDEENTTVDFL